ncbi:MAG TPA: hypothetical protein VLX44_02240 [Xanthobacteraceae bacterium]|nr:hypothetical protein [Xanthobacteraceae bacterium]
MYRIKDAEVEVCLAGFDTMPQTGDIGAATRAPHANDCRADAVRASAFPLEDCADQLVQVSELNPAPARKSSVGMRRGQVGSKDVEFHLNRIMELCDQVIDSFTRTMESERERGALPAEISGQMVGFGLSVGPIVQCFAGVPPDPIIKEAEPVAVRIESTLAAKLRERDVLTWFMRRLAEVVRHTFGASGHDDVIIIFYDSIFSTSKDKRRNRLVSIDLNTTRHASLSDEKRQLIQHLGIFFDNETLSQALRYDDVTGPRGKDEVSVGNDSAASKPPIASEGDARHRARDGNAPERAGNGDERQRWRAVASIAAAVFIASVIGILFVCGLAVGSSGKQIFLVSLLAISSFGLLASVALTRIVDDEFGISRL